MADPVEWNSDYPVLICKLSNTIDKETIWAAIFSVESLRWTELMHAREGSGSVYAIVFLRGSNTLPESATQLREAQRFYPECRSERGKVLFCYEDDQKVKRIVKPEEEVAQDDLKKAMELLPDHEVLESGDWLTGVLYASVWPMSVAEMGGTVDVLLKQKQKENDSMNDKDG